MEIDKPLLFSAQTSGPLHTEKLINNEQYLFRGKLQEQNILIG